MDTLALTDRDGVYGAVKFARAARSAGIRPVLGVDLALEPTGLLSPPRMVHPSLRSRADRPGGPPGAGRRHRRPAAPAGHPAGPGQGRLGGAVPAGVGHPPARRAREAGEHPRPGRRARPGRGRRRRRPAGAARPRAPRSAGRSPPAGPTWPGRCWPAGRSVVEPHRPGARGGLAPRPRRPAPGRPDARAGRRGAAHRGAHQRGALRRPLRRPDRRRARRVPPAGRRWTPATSTGSTPRATSSPARRWRRSPRRSPPRRGWTSEGGPPAARRDPAGRRPVRASTRGPTSAWARCTSPTSTSWVAVDDRRPGGGRAGDAAAALRGRAGPAGDGRHPRGAAPARRRARGHRAARLPVVLPHRRRRRRPDPRHGGAGRGPRLGRRQPGQLPARHLRGRPDPARPADGAVPLAAARGAARRRHRRRVGPAYRGLRADPRPVRRRAGRLRLDDGHLPGAARDPRRRRRPGHAAGRDRPDRQGVPAHPGPRRARGAARAARAAGVATRQGASSTCCSGWSRGSTGCRGTSRCTRAGCCCPTPRCSTAPRSRRAGWASR